MPNLILNKQLLMLIINIFQNNSDALAPTYAGSAYGISLLCSLQLVGEVN